MTSYKRLYQQEKARNDQLQDKLLWALDQLKQTGQPVGTSGEDKALEALHARNAKIRHRSPQRPQT